jgi:hypothetical protein
MYKTSTFFKKAEIPGATIPVLLDLYREELKYQTVTHIEVNSNSIDFRDDLLKVTYKGQPSKFGNFSSARITIEETAHEYVVTFSADMSRLLNKSGYFAGLVPPFIVVGAKMIDKKMLGTPFHTTMLTFSLIYFLVVLIFPYCKVLLFFPDYLDRLRERFECEIRQGRNTQQKSKTAN